ncbi:MAG: VWA domain-containing protein [Deinococcota bacterium]
MTDEAVSNELVHVQFADNPDPRVPCLLLLDTSHSMAGEAIAALNEGLQTFKRDIMQDALARRRVEVAIISFGNRGVNLVQDFVTVDDFEPPVLTAGGSTPLGQALEDGLALLRTRKDVYNQAGVQYYRPWVFLITDGAPTDAWQQQAAQIQQEEATRGLSFFCVGVERADMTTLAQIASDKRPPLKLKGLAFNELFLWLSQSHQRVSHSRIGDQVATPAIGWGSVDV